MSMSHKPQILVVDDDRQIREALTARLEQAGFEVIAARDVRSAIASFDRRSPDAAVVDVELPDADGFAVCEHIRARGSTIPVFYLTGAETGIVKRHLHALTSAVGANHFVRKPYDGKMLVIMLREALAMCDAECARQA
jgi:DNA-binding response OmpR family regulator